MTAINAKDVTQMLSRMRITRNRPDEVDDVRRDWEYLLANATSPQERDEINDVFSRSHAA